MCFLPETPIISLRGAQSAYKRSGWRGLSGNKLITLPPHLSLPCPTPQLGTSRRNRSPHLLGFIRGLLHVSMHGKVNTLITSLINTPIWINRRSKPVSGSLSATPGRGPLGLSGEPIKQTLVLSVSTGITKVFP